MKYARYAALILCDDVREEVGGKLSMMGIYHKDVVLPQMPMVLRSLCVCVILNAVKNIFSKCRFVLSLPGNKPLTVNLETEMEGKLGSDVIISSIIANIPVKSSGKAKIQFFFENDSRASLVRDFDVLLKTDPKRSQQQIS